MIFAAYIFSFILILFGAIVMLTTFKIGTTYGISKQRYDNTKTAFTGALTIFSLGVILFIIVFLIQIHMLPWDLQVLKNNHVLLH